MIVKDNQREILEKDAKRKYIEINNYCELSLERFLNNSIEIIEELLGFARKNGIVVNKRINLVLADFSRTYRKCIDLQ